MKHAHAANNGARVLQQLSFYSCKHCGSVCQLTCMCWHYIRTDMCTFTRNSSPYTPWTGVRIPVAAEPVLAAIKSTPQGSSRCSLK